MGLYFRHPSSLAHETGAHPERPDRLRAIERALDEAGWPGLEVVGPPAAERSDLERVHASAYVGEIERFCRAGGGMIDADTVAVEASWEAALHAAGAAVEAARRLLAGEARFAFCGLRPPGHHAETARGMGFCLFNNVAVGVAAAIAAGEAGRALIVDWDVHHGNGTAEIFAARDDVLYASVHQSPLYPGTGHPDEVGTGAGEGYTVNLPVPPGSDGERFLALLQHVIVPIARELEPDLLAISAGYDAHADDPLANCMLREADYGHLTAAMRELATELDAPLMVCLEGGYDLDALAGSVLTTVRAATGTATAPEAPVALAGEALDRLRSRWPVLAG